MSMFDNFPFSNFNSVNLDWIVEKLKELEERVEELEERVTELENE